MLLAAPWQCCCISIWHRGADPRQGVVGRTNWTNGWPNSCGMEQAASCTGTEIHLAFSQPCDNPINDRLWTRVADSRAVHRGRQADGHSVISGYHSFSCLFQRGDVPGYMLYALSCSRRNESRLFLVSATSRSEVWYVDTSAAWKNLILALNPGKHERLNLKCATHPTVTACVPISTWGQKRGNSR